ncbi:hypothetical protein VCHA50O407_390002 [Vibrio chagasii]|nr:hypothetical protein VCHA50O407_390002 [Vibrio chagasii]
MWRRRLRPTDLAKIIKDRASSFYEALFYIEKSIFHSKLNLKSNLISTLGVVYQCPALSNSKYLHKILINDFNIIILFHPLLFYLSFLLRIIANQVSLMIVIINNC